MAGDVSGEAVSRSIVESVSKQLVKGNINMHRIMLYIDIYRINRRKS